VLRANLFVINDDDIADYDDDDDPRPLLETQDRKGREGYE